VVLKVSIPAFVVAALLGSVELPKLVLMFAVLPTRSPAGARYQDVVGRRVDRWTGGVDADKAGTRRDRNDTIVAVAGAGPPVTLPT